MSTRTIMLAAGLAWWLPASALATPPSYDDKGGYTLTLPYDSSSFGTALSSFPPSDTRVVEGYALASRLLAATGRQVLLQTTFGGSDFQAIAVTDPNDRPMDPCFVLPTRSGELLALGMGLDKPLYVFPASLLSLSTPPNLAQAGGVRTYELSYYDAAWRDERYLFLNAGTDMASVIYVVDTTKSGDAAISVGVADIPGASAGLVFDASGNLITGIGYDYDDGVRTGELRIFSSAEVTSMIAGGTSLSYDDDGALLADKVLSAASLQIDADGDLLVGGGDVVGSSLGQRGFAAVIDHTVLQRALGGGAPLDPSNKSEYTQLMPDPCHNDDATGVTYVPGVDMVLVTANLATQPPDCAAVDWSGGGAPVAYAYFPPDAPDEDGDGVPNGVDPDYLPRDVVGRAELDRLMAAFGATSSDSNFDADLDSDGDHTIQWSDYDALLTRWGKL